MSLENGERRARDSSGTSCVNVDTRNRHPALSDDPIHESSLFTECRTEPWTVARNSGDPSHVPGKYKICQQPYSHGDYNRTHVTCETNYRQQMLQSHVPPLQTLNGRILDNEIIPPHLIFERNGRRTYPCCSVFFIIYPSLTLIT